VFLSGQAMRRYPVFHSGTPLCLFRIWLAFCRWPFLDEILVILDSCYSATFAETVADMIRQNPLSTGGFWFLASAMYVDKCIERHRFVAPRPISD
jgi:hypothetical protein